MKEKKNQYQEQLDASPRDIKWETRLRWHKNVQKQSINSIAANLNGMESEVLRVDEGQRKMNLMWEN